MKKPLIIVALLIVLAAGWFWGLPAYRGFKERKFAAQARAHFAKGEYRPALLSAQQTLALNPRNLTACEVMAELAEGSRSPHAVIWRQRITAIAPTMSNWVVLASSAMRFESPPFVIAQESLANAQKAGNSSTFVPFQVVSAQLALKLGRIPEAEKFFETAIRLEPTNRLHQLNVATVRLESKDAAVSRAAHEELERMQADAQLGEHALRALATHHAARKQFDDALKFSTTLITRTNAVFDDRLQHLTLLHEIKKPAFDGYATQLQQAASTNAQRVFALSSQLLALGEAQRTLTWLKTLPRDMQADQPVPLAFADTLARLKDWRGMEERLSSERWKDQDYMRLALMAYAVRQQNDESVSKVHWDKAVQLAADRSERLMVLVQMAANWRWDAEADALLWRVVKSFPREQWAIETLHSAYMRTRNTRGLFSVYATMMDRESTNAMVMNNYANVALLLQTNTSRAHELAKRVYDLQTNNSVFLSTYAWSLHLQGKSAEALQVMERIPAAQLGDPSVAGYYGVLLAVNGQKEKARGYLDRAVAGALLPEEKAIAEEARRKL